MPPSATTEANAPADFTLFPNPAHDRLFLRFNDPDMQAYYIRITDVVGRTLFMLPQPDLHAGIDVSKLKAGIYILECRDAKTKKSLTKRFVMGNSR